MTKKLLILLLFNFLSNMTNAHAQLPDVGSDQLETIQFLAYLNRSSLIEPAGSLGSFGAPMGLSVSKVSAVNGDDNHLTNRILTPTRSSDQLLNTYVSINKGTDWPVDFGVTVSHTNATNMHNIGANIQFTLLEGLGLPALSTRWYWTRAFGLKDAKIDTHAAEFVASYSLLRYFKFFGTARYDKSFVELQLNDSHYYGLVATDSSWSVNRSVQSIGYTFGLKINLHPTLAIAGEMNQTNVGLTSMGVKLGLLL